MVWYWLCAFGGAGVGALGVIWCMQQGCRARLIKAEQRRKIMEAELGAAKNAWTSFAVCTLPLIPILVRQMHAVTEQTERAVLDIMAKLQGIVRRESPQGVDVVQRAGFSDSPHEEGARMSRQAGPQLSQQRARELDGDVNQIVMALQFQDITRQKLEHIEQALTQMRDHMQHLIDGKQDEELRDSLVMLKTLDQSYTMESERRLHTSSGGHADDGKVGAWVVQAAGDEESVTMF